MQIFPAFKESYNLWVVQAKYLLTLTSTTYRIIPYYLPNYKTTAKTIFKCRLKVSNNMQIYRLCLLLSDSIGYYLICFTKGIFYPYRYSKPLCIPFCRALETLPQASGLDMSVVTDLRSLLHTLSPELKNEVRKLEKVSLKLFLSSIYFRNLSTY